MPTFEAVKVAAVQATPLILDSAASVASAAQFWGEAGRVAGPSSHLDIGRVHQR